LRLVFWTEAKMERFNTEDQDVADEGPHDEIEDAAGTGLSSVAGDFITIDELAVVLNLDRKTVYGMAERREFPGAQRCGRTWRVHLPTVVRWFSASSCSARRGGRK
jgi:excisionase family DNA binding protein